MRAPALAVLGALAAGAAVSQASGPTPIFADIAARAGLRAPTWCGRPEKPHLLESGGTGLALFDYDGDGDLDLYLVNGWRLAGAEVVERGRNVLYRNQGPGDDGVVVFEDVTDKAGVGDDGWGTGVAVGDADGDGRPDLLVTNFGPDVLYRNRGDGTFERVGGAPSIDGWSSGAVLFDADRDGDEDLFLGAYVDCTLDEVLHARPTLDWEGIKVMLGPFGLEGLANRYFENLGGGRFEEATERAGLVDVGRFFTFTVAALDLDGDLDLDLYVANDSNPNYLYRNDGTGRFKEVGLWSGAALDAAGNAQAGMGVAAGDLEADGRVDLFVTNFHRDASTFYRNLGDFIFEDTSRVLGLSQPTYEPLSWGTTLADLDLDGDLDVVVVNGHIYPQADSVETVTTSFKQRNLLLRGDGRRFVDATDQAGPGFEVIESSRGLAVGDIDGDGDLDLAISNVDAPPTLLRNDTPTDGAWLLVDAPRAMKVVVEAGGQRFVRHRVIGGSYVSVSDTRFHFGLGPVSRIDRVVVTWPDGSETVQTGLASRRVVAFP